MQLNKLLGCDQIYWEGFRDNLFCGVSMIDLSLHVPHTLPLWFRQTYSMVLICRIDNAKIQSHLDTYQAKPAYYRSLESEDESEIPKPFQLPKQTGAGCSEKNVFFFKNFQYFATSTSPSMGCYWLFQKWPANRSDCTLPLL